MNTDFSPFSRRFLKTFTLIFVVSLVVWISFDLLAHLPVPTPKPYPGTSISTSRTSTTCSHTRTEYFITQYQVSHPLSDLKEYYSDEMAQYCQEEWSWRDVNYPCNGLSCQTAYCRLDSVPYSLVSQWVSVSLIAESSTQTRVRQVQHIDSKSLISPKFCGE